MHELFTWQDIVERSIELPAVPLSAPYAHTHEFSIPRSGENEELREGELLKGSIERCNERIDGSVEVKIEPLDDRLFKVAVEIVNESPCPDVVVGDPGKAEILTLRIMTMTDDERAEMRSVDEFARRIVHRTESQEDLLRMHGTFRDLRSMTDFFERPTR